MARFERILSGLLNEPWYIQPEKLAAIVDAIQTKIHVGISAEDIEAVRAQSAESQPGVQAGVQVLPVFGTMSNRLNLMSAFSGGVSTSKLRHQINVAAANPEVHSIVLHVDSPGGSVYGVDELASAIRRARKEKPVVVQVDALAASAAYYAASAADEIIVTPSGEVGSIGVYLAHVDQSKFLEMAGLRVRYIWAGQYKVEGNPNEALTGEAAEFLQSRVDGYYSAFVRAVAEGRGVTQAQVINGFGQGRVVGADYAVREDMADRTGTIEETLGRLTDKRRRARIKRRAQAKVLEARALINLA